MQEWLVLITFGIAFLLALVLSVLIRLIPFFLGYVAIKEILKDNEKEQEP